MQRFDELWGSITKHYAPPAPGEPFLPLHLSKSDESIFWISTYDDFKKMSHFQKQDLMRKRKVVVVTGVPTDDCAFDEDGLSELAGLDVPVDMQGTSAFTKSIALILTPNRFVARSLSQRKERELQCTITIRNFAPAAWEFTRRKGAHLERPQLSFERLRYYS